MTTTANSTLQQILDQGNPALVGTAAAKMKLGTMMTPLKRVFTGLASSATQDLSAIDGTGEVVGAANPKRLAALCVNTLRVTAGTLAAGPAVVTDVGGTPTAIGTGSVHVVTLSDDGKTLVFQAAVTAFVIEYIPRSSVDMTANDGALGGSP